jgi:hypothetical protein
MGCSEVSVGLYRLDIPVILLLYAVQMQFSKKQLKTSEYMIKNVDNLIEI